MLISVWEWEIGNDVYMSNNIGLLKLVDIWTLGGRLFKKWISGCEVSEERMKH